jgi:hypothetical protein
LSRCISLRSENAYMVAVGCADCNACCHTGCFGVYRVALKRNGNRRFPHKVARSANMRIPSLYTEAEIRSISPSDDSSPSRYLVYSLGEKAESENSSQQF